MNVVPPLHVQNAGRTPIEPPQFVEVPETMVACLPIVVARALIAPVMDSGVRELFATLKAQGIEPQGPWFTHHRIIDPAIFDFSICVPVVLEVEPVGRVRPGLLPATRVVRTIYRGPYEKLGEAWGLFRAWITDERIPVRDDLWESYLDGPESGLDPARWRTELNAPLRQQRAVA